MYVLILFCTQFGPGCIQQQVAPSFENRDFCEQIASNFNADPANKKVGATEACLLLEPTGR